MSKASSKLAASVSKVRKQPAASVAAKRAATATSPSSAARDARQVKMAQSKLAGELHPARVWPD
jgi:hypothetical protein